MEFLTFPQKKMSQWISNKNTCQTVTIHIKTIQIATHYLNCNIRIPCLIIHHLQCIIHHQWTTCRLNNLKECLGISLWTNFPNICMDQAVIKTFNLGETLFNLLKICFAFLFLYSEMIFKINRKILFFMYFYQTY